jgi:ABC-type multidrug transport system fused ATPase/permease subunit
MQERDAAAMARLIVNLLRPYRGRLCIVFIAMLIEIVASLAAPWTLKLVIDDAVGQHRLPEWLAWAHDYGIGRHTMGVALFAGLATIVIAVVGAIATYIDNYYTTNIGQWIANDLRLRIYQHLHRLSLRYYDHAKIGSLISTIMTDVDTLQEFASSSTLDILVDLLTIVFMVGLMFWLNWDFTLIALGVTPFLLFFVMRLKKAVKDVTRVVRAKQSEILAVVQQGLGSVRAIKAFAVRIWKLRVLKPSAMRPSMPPFVPARSSRSCRRWSASLSRLARRSFFGEGHPSSLPA